MKQFFLHAAFAVLLTFTASFSFSQGYKIKGQIRGLENAHVMLAYYYGDKQYIRDTVPTNAKGEFTFSGDEPLGGGIYLVVTPKKKFFEFIITEQEFSFSTDTLDFVKNMKFSDSYENKVFYDYLQFITPRGMEMDRLRREQMATQDESQKKALTDKMTKIDQEVMEYRLNVIKKEPKSFLAKLITAMKDFEVPEAPEGHPDPNDFKYRYYKAHYWDNIDLQDDRTLRTPLYNQKFNQYWEKMLIHHPDTMVAEADAFIKRVEGTEELYKYSVITITNWAAKSKIMCMDKLYVHMVDEYYATGKAPWISEEQKETMLKEAEKMRMSLCDKPAMNIELKDPDGKMRSLYDVDAEYTLLYFWDPDCGHCKKTTPVMDSIAQKYADKGLKVFSVNTAVEEEKWKEYIRDHSLENWINVADLEYKNPFREYWNINATPVTYLLDRNKKIIAKKFDPAGLDQIMKQILENGGIGKPDKK